LFKLLGLNDAKFVSEHTTKCIVKKSAYCKSQRRGFVLLQTSSNTVLNKYFWTTQVTENEVGWDVTATRSKTRIVRKRAPGGIMQNVNWLIL